MFRAGRPCSSSRSAAAPTIAARALSLRGRPRRELDVPRRSVRRLYSARPRVGSGAPTDQLAGGPAGATIDSMTLRKLKRIAPLAAVLALATPVASAGAAPPPA